jgi:uncharacterized protein YegL
MADQVAKAKGVVDIVFLIDITGSMQSCIDALKNNISTFIDSLTTRDANNTNPVKHWRAKVVGYRDFGEDAEHYVDHAFVEDAASLKVQLSRMTAGGGGDEPESLLDALYRVTNMGQTEKGAASDPQRWRYRSEAARVVIIFTDASYHDTMVEPAGGTVGDVANAVMANRIILSIFAPNMPCYDKLSEIDRSELNAFDYDSGDSQGAQKALTEFTKDQANFKKTLMQLAKSVSKSAETPSL